MYEIVEKRCSDNYYQNGDVKSECATMYVCLCNGVTDTQITALLAEGEKGMRDLRQELKVGTSVLLHLLGPADGQPLFIKSVSRIPRLALPTFIFAMSSRPEPILARLRELLI